MGEGKEWQMKGSQGRVVGGEGEGEGDGRGKIGG